MQANESTVDRIIRVVLGIVLLVLAYLGTITGAWQWIAYIIGGILFITGLAGFCPLYALFHFRTKE